MQSITSSPLVTSQIALPGAQRRSRNTELLVVLHEFTQSEPIDLQILRALTTLELRKSSKRPQRL